MVCYIEHWLLNMLQAQPPVLLLHTALRLSESVTNAFVPGADASSYMRVVLPDLIMVSELDVYAYRS
jgi:hypothetical protein